MSVKSYVRDVSPYFQEFIVRLMGEAYRARIASDVLRYRVVIEHLFDSLPGHVRVETLAELGHRLGIKVTDLKEVLAYADSECERIRSSYGRPIREKEEECTSIQLEILNALYSVLTLKIHEKGLLTVTKIVQVGEL